MAKSLFLFMLLSMLLIGSALVSAYSYYPGNYQTPIWYESAYDYVYEPYWQYPISTYGNNYYGGYGGYGYGGYGGYGYPGYGSGSGYGFGYGSQQGWQDSLWYTLWTAP